MRRGPSRFILPIIVLLAIGGDAAAGETARVEIAQATTNSGTLCRYRLHNGTHRFISRVTTLADQRPAAAPGQTLRLTQGTQPRTGGWSGTFMADRGAVMTWIGNTADVVIAPDETIDFAFELNQNIAVRCDQFRVTTESVERRPERPPQPSIAVSIASLSQSSNGQLVGRIELRNAGPGDALLNLGERESPDNLELVHVDASGGRTVMRGPPRMIHWISARGGDSPMALPLPPGAVYALERTWVLWSVRPPLKPGLHRFVLQVEGINPVFLDSPGPVIRWWRGSAESAPFELTIF